MARGPRRPAPQARPDPEAKEAYDAAIAAIENSAERAYLSRRRGELV